MARASGPLRFSERAVTPLSVLGPACQGRAPFIWPFAWMDIQYYTLCAPLWRDLLSRKLFCFCTALSTNYRHALHS